MGLDTYFEMIGVDGVDRPSLWRKNKHAILWLACFRVSDIVFSPEHDGIYIGTVRCPSGHAELPTNVMGADFTGRHFDKFLMHALLGFSNPGCKMFYDPSDVERGLRVPATQRVPGVMTWGDVLRVLTLRHEGITLRHLGEGSRIHPPTALFTADEYAREGAPLAGS